MASIRAATVDDAARINDIFNYYVNSTATFVISPQTLDDRLVWLNARSQAHPVVVAEEDGVVVGWGSISAFRQRAAYSRTVEIGVYIHHDFHRRGIGRALVADLMERATTIGHHVIVAGCCSESVGSIKLLEACEFSRVAHFREVGYKFDRWLDVLFYQRVL